MTGSKLLGLCLLMLAAPALAQSPQMEPRPDAPSPALPGIVIDGTLSGPVSHPHVDGLRAVYGGEVTFGADQADADMKARRYTLRGQVRLHETDTTVHADEVLFDGQTQRAEAAQALLTQGIFTIRSERIDATPAQIIAENADFSTVPPDITPDFHLHAQSLVVDHLDQPRRLGTFHSVSAYLFGTRLLTIPQVRFHFGTGSSGAAARRQAVIPMFGVSARYGAYLSLGGSLPVARFPIQYRLLLPVRQSVEVALTSRQTLYTAPASPSPPAPERPQTLLERIRVAATVPPGPLPDGDPLLFHDFLPEGNPIRLFDSPARGGVDLSEELSTHVAAQGRGRDDLYVSRLPEATLHGLFPLTRLPDPPTPGDPLAFRASLRRLVLYGEAQETVGDYRELPAKTTARRYRSQIGFSTRPLLIAPNTVLLPSLSISSSSYSGSMTAYRYDQAALAVNHYFSDLTAVGVQFLASNVGGDSPFNFDVLDTTREMDVRLQIGGRRVTIAGRLRYDLARSHVIDYQLALAPMLNGFTPVFSYNFRTRSLGLGVEIKGITF